MTVLFTTNAETLDAQDGATTWEDRLQASSRDAAVVALFLALTRQVDDLATALPDALLVPLDGDPLLAAHDAEMTVPRLLNHFLATATALVAAQAPAIIAALAASVGVDARETDAAALSDAIDGYLATLVRETARVAGRAVADWTRSGGTLADLAATLKPILGAVSWQALRIVRTELQAASVTVARRAMTARGATLVRRIVQPNACDFCKGLAGVHDVNDPDLYATHPQCLCQWEIVDAAPFATFGPYPLEVAS